MSQTHSKSIGRRIARAYASSLISTSLVLFVVGVASMLLQGAGEIESYFRANEHATAVVKAGVSERRALKYKEWVDSQPYVLRTRFVSAEEGARELAELLGEDFLKAFADTPVPMSVEVTLKPEYTDFLDDALKSLGADPIIEEVDYRKPLLDTLHANLAKITMVFGAVMLLLLFVSTVLISNTVRLTIHSQRFNIYTMQLVGATRSYIMKPYLRSALLQGVLSALIACGITGGLLFALKASIGQIFDIFPTQILAQSCAVVFAVGIFIFVTSTFIIVRRLATMSKEEIYGQ